MPPMTAEEIEAEAQRGFEEYRSKVHPNGMKSLAPTQAELDAEAAKRREDQLKDAAPYMLGGAGAGAIATQKDLIRRAARKIFAPGSPDIYGPKQVPGTTPNIPRVEPSFPVAPQANLDSETQKIMQSIKDETGSTGRQRERGHNWETNREAMATKQNLAAPGAPKIIVESGPMTPTRGGIAIPQGVAQSIEDERLMQEARRRAADETLKREAEILQRTEDAKRARAAEEAARSASRAGKVAGIGKVGLGALGGALSAKELYDMYNEPNKENWTDEDYVRLIGALGGLASTVPLPWAQGIGLGTSGLSVAYPYLKEYFRGNQSPKR